MAETSAGSVAAPAVVAASRGHSYQRVAPFYEELARVLSRGQIGAAKLSQLDWLGPGDRVLYAGVGSGEDAAAAAQAGVRVTALDLSARMLERLHARLAEDAACASLRCEDFFAHEADPYDAVVLNFFLNVFAPDDMERALDRAIGLLRPDGGRLLIADFAPPAGRLERVVFELHYRPLLWGAWLLGLADLHPIYDYRARLEARGLQSLGSRRFAPFGRRFGLYEAQAFSRTPANSPLRSQAERRSGRPGDPPNGC